MSEHSVPMGKEHERFLTGDLDAVVFAELLGATCGDFLEKCGDIHRQFDFRYEVAAGYEHDAIVLDVLRNIESGAFKVSGKERRDDWEKGWQENLDAFEASGHDCSALVPRYISKFRVSRLLGRYIRPLDPMFELNFYTVYRQFLFKTYLEQVGQVYEFGCGTGYNLVILNNLFPEKPIIGLDWAESSVQIAQTLGTRHNAAISGRRFDYFSPDQSLEIPPGTALLTLNSLEQIGGDFGRFLDFILEKKPAICINSEPIVEMYDDDYLLDNLAIRYHNARNYLTGYYRELKRLEAKGTIEIIRSQRVPVGNYYHEGFSFVVWRIND